VRAREKNRTPARFCVARTPGAAGGASRWFICCQCHALLGPEAVHAAVSRGHHTMLCNAGGEPAAQLAHPSLAVHLCAHLAIGSSAHLHPRQVERLLEEYEPHDDASGCMHGRVSVHVCVCVSV